MISCQLFLDARNGTERIPDPTPCPMIILVDSKKVSFDSPCTFAIPTPLRPFVTVHTICDQQRSFFLSYKYSIFFSFLEVDKTTICHLISVISHHHPHQLYSRSTHPQLVSCRLPVLRVLITFRAEVLHCFRRLKVCRMCSGFCYHLTKFFRVLQHRTWAKHIIRKLFIDQCCICKTKEYTIGMLLTKTDQIFLTNQRFSTRVNI